MRSMEVWAGRAGSGKSAQVLREIAKQAQVDPFGDPIWWIVPSDASYATERLLLSMLPATVRVEVITLNRLAERVMEGIGHLVTPNGVPFRRMNRIAKRILMAEVYEQCRPALSVFGRDGVTTSFLDALLEAMSEVDQCQVSPGERDRIIQGLNLWTSSQGSASDSHLGRKWTELWRLKECFDQAAADEGLWDGDIVMDRVTPHLSTYEPLARATLFLDGFSSLSDMEVAFLVKLSALAKRTVLTLSLDPSWLESENDALEHETPYAPQTLRLWGQIQRVCSLEGLDLVISRLFEQPVRFVAAPMLAHLEQHLYRFTRPPFVPNGEAAEPVSVHICAAQNPRIEVQAVLQQIEQDVRITQIPFANIAVVVPNLQAYLPYIQDGFEQAGIPYTTDDFPVFSTHPLARLLTAVLEAAETGLTQSAALRVLKTDFPGITRDDADWLEAYVRRYDVPTSVYWDDVEPWTCAALSGGHADAKCLAEDARATDIKSRWCSIFQPVIAALREPALSPAALAEALWRLLEAVGARRKVATWMVNQDGQLSPLEASLHEQAWDFVMGMLNDFASAPRETTLTLAYAQKLLVTAMNEAVLSTIPGHVNSVLVTEVGRAEGWDVDVVFVLGATDGLLPARIQPFGVWLDDERTTLSELLGRPFGLTTEQRQWDERKTVYQALTRARRALWVTYPMSGMDGKSARPASVVGRIKRLFDDAGVSERLWTEAALWSALPKDITIWNKEAALAWFAREYRRLGHALDGENTEATMAMMSVVRWLGQDGQYRIRLRQVLQGTLHRVASQPLAPELAEQLFRGPTLVSVSQLETYAACPYQHFLKYGLRISDDLHRQSAEAAARGTLVHAVLQHFVEHLNQDADCWRSLSHEEAVSMMQRTFEQVLGQPEFAGWARSSVKTRVAEGARRVLERAAIVLTEHTKHSAFRPKLLEFTFGERDGQGHSLELPLPDGRTVAFRGRIDRVDVADGDQPAFRILDYKSSAFNLDLALVWHGLQLQLPVYAALIEQISEKLFGTRSTCAGVFYLPVLRKVSSVAVPQTEFSSGTAALSQMRAKGYFLEDMSVIDRMDDRLVLSEDSPLFTKVYNKDGTVAKRAPVLGRRIWRGIFNHALNTTYRMAREIGTGHIAIRPYRLPAQETACQTCSFRPVCHIDPRHDQSPFRRLSVPHDVVERYSDLPSSFEPSTDLAQPPTAGSREETV